MYKFLDILLLINSVVPLPKVLLKIGNFFFSTLCVISYTTDRKSESQTSWLGELKRKNRSSVSPDTTSTVTLE